MITICREIPRANPSTYITCLLPTEAVVVNSDEVSFN